MVGRLGFTSLEYKRFRVFMVATLTLVAALFTAILALSAYTDEPQSIIRLNWTYGTLIQRYGDITLGGEYHERMYLGLKAFHETTSLDSATILWKSSDCVDDYCDVCGPSSDSLVTALIVIILLSPLMIVCAFWRLSMLGDSNTVKFGVRAVPSSIPTRTCVHVLCV